MTTPPEMANAFLAIQKNGDGRPCGWGLAYTKEAAIREAKRQWKSHGECYPGETPGELTVVSSGPSSDLTMA